MPLRPKKKVKKNKKLFTSGVGFLRDRHQKSKTLGAINSLS